MMTATPAHILIVDDKNNNLKLLFKILTQNGYSVRVIADSRQVLASVTAQPPDLILLDVMMPHLDGYQVCAQLKANEIFAEIPVIFLSALSDIEDKLKAFQVGGIDYITKPFQTQEILARVHTHLTLYQLQAELKAKNAQLEREIRQRQQAETALSERNRTLNTLLANLPGMVYRCRNDQDWTMLFVSAGCLELTGYHPDEFMDNRDLAYADLIDPEDQERLWLEVQAALAVQQPFVVSYRIKTRHNQEKWIWEQGQGVFSPTGELLALEGFVMDITERKQTEKALRSSEQRFRSVVEQTPIGLCITDEHGYFEFVNAAYCRIYHYSPEALLGRHFSIIVPIAQGAEVSGEWQVHTQEGQQLTVLARAARISGSDGRLKKVTFVLDITDRKQAEQALQHSQQQLQAALAWQKVIFNNSSTGILVVTGARIIAEVNECFLATFGYQRDELLQQSTAILFADDIAYQQFGAQIHAKTAEQEISHLECQLKQKNSGLLWCDISGKAIDRADLSQGVIWVVLDISERKRAERILAQREAHLAVLLKIQHYLLAVQSSEFCYQDILNQIGPVSQAQRVYIFAATEQGRLTCCSEWAKQPYWQHWSIDTFPPEWLQQLQQGQQIAYSSAQPFLQQHQIAAILLLPLRVEAQFFGFIGFDNCLEATAWPSWQISLLQATASALSQALEQQQAEHALKDSQQRLATILNSLEVFIYVVDIESHELLFINRYGRRLFGDVEGQTCWQVLQTHQTQPCHFCAEDGEGRHAEGILTWEEKNTVTQRWFQHQGQVISWIDGRSVRLSVATDITERKQAEEILRRSEEEMRRYFEQPLVGMATVDPRSKKFTQVNDKFCEIMGYSRLELLEMSWRNLTYHEDLAGSLEHMQLLLTGKIDSFTLDKRYVRKDGELVYANVAIHSIRDSHDEFEAIVALVKDITDRKKMELALRTSEKRFRTLVNVIPHGVQEINQQGIITFSNDSSNRILGYEQHALVGKPIWELVAGETEKQQLHDYVHYLLTAQPSPSPYFSVNQRQDGQLIDVKIDWDYEYDQQGSIKGFVAIITDITQQKQAESALKLAQFSLDNAADGLQWVTPEGQILYANDASCQALGYTRDELLALNVTDIDPNVSLENWLQRWQHLKQQHSITLETYHRHRKGYLYPVEITANYLEFNHKEYLFASVRTITDRKKKEQQLQEAIEKAERANLKYLEKNKELIEKNNTLQHTLEQLQATQQELIQSEKMVALGQLVAGVAHELNTPLGAIRSSIDNIAQYVDNTLIQFPQFFQSLSPSRQQDFLMLLRHQRHNNLSAREKRQLKRNLRRQLQHLEDSDNIVELLSDLEIYEHIEPLLPLLQDQHGHTILKNVYQLVSIQKSTRTILTAVDKASKVVFALRTFSRYDQSGNKSQAQIIEGIETALTLYHNQIKHDVELIKNYTDLPLIWCYPDELNQVWCNLIQNALQAMNYKGTLTINTYQHSQHIVVEIIDSGTGIPETIQNKIFEPFFTTKAAGEGSGLGLDIVQKIIHKHEGKIELHSQEGQTRFSIYLPQ